MKFIGQNVEVDMMVCNVLFVLCCLEYVYCVDLIYLYFVVVVRGGFYEILKKLGLFMFFKSDW